MIADWFVPKDPNLWLIGSHHGLIGNPRFFLEKMLKDDRFLGVKCYIVHSPRTDSETKAYFEDHYPGRVNFIKIMGWSGKFAALRSGCVFISHDLDRDVVFPVRQVRGKRIIINLWHGVGMKRTWLLRSENQKQKKKAALFTNLVASSRVDALAKSAAFRKKLRDIWVTGTPRNDIFGGGDFEVPEDLGMQIRRLNQATGGRTLVLYAPTWRGSRKNPNDGFDQFDSNGFRNLVETINKHNAVLGLRLHPRDESMYAHLYDSSPAIVRLGLDRFPEVQVLLKNTDILVTDYSSIWVDFLLTKKPMIAYWPDYGVYSDSKGTIWDLEKIFPGPIVRDLGGLAETLDHLLIMRKYVEEHAKSRSLTMFLFHEFEDGNNSRRILDRLIEQGISTKIS